MAIGSVTRFDAWKETQNNHGGRLENIGPIRFAQRPLIQPPEPPASQSVTTPEQARVRMYSVAPHAGQPRPRRCGRHVVAVFEPLSPLHPSVGRFASGQRGPASRPRTPPSAGQHDCRRGRAYARNIHTIARRALAVISFSAIFFSLPPELSTTPQLRRSKRFISSTELLTSQGYCPLIPTPFHSC